MNTRRQTASLLLITRFFCLFFLLHFLGLYEVNIYAQGIPFTVNFNKQTYHGGTQNWAITQDSDGIIYVANNNGLLEYDGLSWQLTPAGNQSVMRSVAADKVGRIWSGAQSEFGYFEPNSAGILAYHSLRKKLPEPHLEDIWKIVIADDGTVFFHTNKLIFSIKGDKIHKYPAHRSFLFMGKAAGRVVAYDIQHELTQWNPGDSTPIITPMPPEVGMVTAAIPWTPDTLLLTTLYGRIWAIAHQTVTLWNTGVDEFLRNNRIYTAVSLFDGKLALGTSQGGIVILDKHRQPWAFLNKKTGLQNNSILSLFTDRQGNLWAGTNNGIEYVMVNSAYSFLLPDGELEGAAYTADMQNQWVYFGTNNGLYTTLRSQDGNFANKTFTLVNNTQGEVWGISRIQEHLLVGHHVGPLEVQSPSKATHIGHYAGAWTYLGLEGYPNLMLGGSYHGLHLFEKKNGVWQVLKKYPQLQESCRIMVMENPHLLWIAHPYRGIFRVEFSPDFQEISTTFYNAKNGLPSDNFNLVFKIGNEVVFSTEKGILVFDELKGSFETYSTLNNFFRISQRVKFLREGKNGEIWFIAGDETGFLELVSSSPKRQYRKQLVPFLKGKTLGGFEFILPYDESHVLFGTDRGFIFHDRTVQPIRPSGVLLRQVLLTSSHDSLLSIERRHQFLNPLSATYTQLNKDENNLKFIYTLPWFGHHEPVQYATMLQGRDNKWSEWTDKSEKEFINLSPGKYTFLVKARFTDLKETPPTKFYFKISAPWFKSTLAILLYILIVVTLLVYLVIVPKQRFEREKEFLTTEHHRKQEDQRRQTEEATLELDRVRQEKLQAEIAFKNKELASTTLHLLQKGEILHKIQEDIHRIAKKCLESETKKDLNALSRVLAQDAQLDTDWDQFAQHFDQVHAEFIRRLRERYPELTPRDQKLCAYLRMNLSSKEIAPLLNISVRGVEISRYRLRKKLHLEKEANLTDFLLIF